MEKDNIRIGIATFHRPVNYGAVLQAYALQKVLQKLGYNIEIIDFATKKHRDAYDPEKTQNPIYRKTANYNIMRYNKFQQFIENVLSLSKHTFLTSKEFENSEEIKSYDIVITGSDQIWNLNFRGNGWYSDFYFMPYTQIKHRIAYAPSMGSSARSKLLPYVAFMREYDYIFMREKSGAEMVGGLLGRNINQVEDPTLLISKDEWCSRSINMDKPYLLYYEVAGAKDALLIARRMAKKFKLKLKIISLKDVYKGYNIEYIRDAGPMEFVEYIQHASLVITTSFHGTAFSINLEVPFYSIISNKNTSRINTLLEVTGLEDRIICLRDIDNICDYKMDYTNVRPIIEKRRDHSIKLLKGSIEDMRKIIV